MRSLMPITQRSWSTLSIAAQALSVPSKKPLKNQRLPLRLRPTHWKRTARADIFLKPQATTKKPSVNTKRQLPSTPTSPTCIFALGATIAPSAFTIKPSKSSHAPMRSTPKTPRPIFSSRAPTPPSANMQKPCNMPNLPRTTTLPDASLRGNLGVMYYRNSYWTEAVTELGYVVNGGVTEDGNQIEAINLVPNDARTAEYYFTYGLALSRLNQCGEALQVARTILERIPADELLWKMPTRSSAVVSKIWMQTPEPSPTPLEPDPASTEILHPHTMNIYQKRGLFRRRNEPNVYRMFFWIALILGGIWLVRSLNNGDIKPPFQAHSHPHTFCRILCPRRGRAIHSRKIGRCHHCLS